MQTNQKSYFAKDFSSKEQLTTFHGSSTKFPADDFPGTGKENKEWFLLVHLQTRINSVHKTLRFDIYLCSPLKAAPHTHSNGAAASIISTCSTDSPGLVPPPSSLLVQTYKTTAPAQPLFYDVLPGACLHFPWCCWFKGSQMPQVYKYHQEDQLHVGWLQSYDTPQNKVSSTQKRITSLIA